MGATSQFTWPDPVAALCRTHALERDVALATELVARHFNNATCQFEMMQDPDSENQWVVLTFDAAGTVEAVLERYYALIKDWTAQATEAGKLLVRFEHNISAASNAAAKRNLNMAKRDSDLPEWKERRRKLGPVAWWLYNAAQDAGQLALVQNLIRQVASYEMPPESEPTGKRHESEKSARKKKKGKPPESEPTGNRHEGLTIISEFVAEYREMRRMAEEGMSPLACLTMWLHTAARESGQLDLIRNLLRQAFEASRDMYEGQDFEASRDVFEEPAEIPAIISEFVAEWDQYDREMRRMEEERGKSGPKSA